MGEIDRTNQTTAKHKKSQVVIMIIRACGVFFMNEPLYL